LPTLDMSRTATAMVSGDGSPTLIVLDPSARCALDISGGADLVVIGGPIQVNSNDNSAACVAGNSGVSAEAIDAVGHVRASNNPSVDMLINEGMPVLPDPLASLPAPAFPSPQA